ncbi:uncharacterized protein LOC116843663 [Odontomachus brunneus]|uniref:uncharacterized protein LOC116843663 n=1 Tax=Odontomachus brunneus TaxID=486640 RepID=UPI0013F19767|nr:uncharacterized protein LOC116843663 [Odontomachus brunneus]
MHEKPRNGGHREHPPQDTKIVAGPSSWLTAWLELALVGWLEVRTVVERLVGLEIAWWFPPMDLPPYPHRAPTPYGARRGTIAAAVEWGEILGHFDDYPPCSRIPFR